MNKGSNILLNTLYSYCNLEQETREQNGGVFT